MPDTLWALNWLAGVDRIRDRFVTGVLGLYPVEAIDLGYALEDVPGNKAFDDYSPSGVEARTQFWASTSRRLNALTETVPPEQRVDLAIMRNATAAATLDVEVTQRHRYDPSLYPLLAGTALYSLRNQTFATKAVQSEHIASRLRALPLFFSQAQANLVASPAARTAVAISATLGVIEILDALRLESWPTTAKRTACSAAVDEALAAAGNYVGFLEHDLSKRLRDWRLGRDLYEQQFRLLFCTDISPAELLREAEAVAAEIQAQISDSEHVEKQLRNSADPKRKTGSTSRVAAITDSLREATMFVRARQFVALPTRETPHVVEMPTFMRPFFASAALSPAPPLTPNLDAEFWVNSSSPLPDADRDFAASLQHLTMHEAMPGHFVQTAYANDVEPISRRLLRRMFGDRAYIEGWAVYAQQLMLEQGYREDDPELKLVLLKQLMRLTTNAILEIRLHAMNMAEEEALGVLLMQHDGQEQGAKERLSRLKLSSASMSAYYFGWRGWIECRNQMRSIEGPEFSLRAFHERALRLGAVPISMLNELLLAQVRTKRS